MFHHAIVLNIEQCLPFQNVLNREIMREIQRLRVEQEAFAAREGEGGSPYNPTLLAELRLLRQRKDELESRMAALQESRKDLMVQLETLMKVLKVKVLHFSVNLTLLLSSHLTLRKIAI